MNQQVFWTALSGVMLNRKKANKDYVRNMIGGRPLRELYFI